MTTNKQTTHFGRKASKDTEETPRLRGVWSNMRQRCYNPNTRQYKHYGGRGITVCDEWRDNYSCFREWALKNGYRQGLTIDRINNDEGYSPENCRWATYKEQERNRRGNRKLTLNGETKCLSEWAETFGISVSALSNRLKNGWSLEAALTKQTRKKSADVNNLSDTINARIEERAKAKGLSICKLEQLAGVANGIVSKLRNGGGIRIDTIVKIAKALDVSVDYLLGITDEE